MTRAPGVLNQTGGDLNTSGFYLGRNAGSNGTFNLSSGGNSEGVMYVGIQGMGTANQQGWREPALTLALPA